MDIGDDFLYLNGPGYTLEDPSDDVLEDTGDQDLNAEPPSEEAFLAEEAGAVYDKGRREMWLVRQPKSKASTNNQKLDLRTLAAPERVKFQEARRQDVISLVEEFGAFSLMGAEASQRFA